MSPTAPSVMTHPAGLANLFGRLKQQFSSGSRVAWPVSASVTSNQMRARLCMAPGPYPRRLRQSSARAALQSNSTLLSPTTDRVPPVALHRLSLLPHTRSLQSLFYSLHSFLRLRPPESRFPCRPFQIICPWWTNTSGTYRGWPF
jgi:hypothetical protein